MSVIIDKAYVVQLLRQNHVSMFKGVNLPAELIFQALTVYGDKLFLENLPDEWLSPELLKLAIDNENFLICKKFKDANKFNVTLNKEEMISIVELNCKFLNLFHELPYEIWLKNTAIIIDIEYVPKEYLTEELIIAMLLDRKEIPTELLTDSIIDKYIDQAASIGYIPKELITEARVKRVLTLDKDANISNEILERIKIDEELSDLLINRYAYVHFKFIPNKTKARVMTAIVNSRYNTMHYLTQFINKKWLGVKFYKELLEMSQGGTIQKILRIWGELKVEKDLITLLKLYPETIMHIPKTEQTKEMVEIILVSGKAAELTTHLSLKFITKTSAPRFIISKATEVTDKVERVLSGRPKDPPVYTIPLEDQISLDIDGEDIQIIQKLNIPYIKNP